MIGLILGLIGAFAIGSGYLMGEAYRSLDYPTQNRYYYDQEPEFYRRMKL